MSYSTDHLRAAGKITVYTALFGVLIFAFVFIFNLGTTEIKQVDAQSGLATTSVTVLNTPPEWTVDAEEVIGSSATATPTNVGDTVSWRATATDANSERFYLLVCTGTSSPTAPTANPDAAPTCANGQIQWGVSASTTSGAEAVVSTTTSNVGPFTTGDGESFGWYAWVCDGNSGTPRCSATTTQGSGTTSSPFEVNHRPLFSLFSDDSPQDPGGTINFYATSSDTDTSGPDDTVKLTVCSEAGFNTVTDTCSPGSVLASSTLSTSDPTAVYTLPALIQDQNYEAIGYVTDNHGFESFGVASGTDSVMTVSNVAPTISSSTIFINGGLPMAVSDASTETTGFTLEFTSSDANTCDAVNGSNGDEVTGFELSLYRDGTGPVVSSSSTCPIGGPYNPNRCYTSSVATTTWNLSCTASTTTCTAGATMDWDCTLPLWYIADPTDGTATSTQYSTNDWKAQLRLTDDDSATSSFVESATGVNVSSFLAMELNTLTIPYGSLEPGADTGTLAESTTISATGNVGLDQKLTGTAMCEGYSGLSPCANSATSTIPDSSQHFGTSTLTTYALGTSLSSTTQLEVEVNVPKSTATTSQANADVTWGIGVPGSISYSGDYTGENTFYLVTGEQVDW